MGYYTNYELVVTGFENSDLNIYEFGKELNIAIEDFFDTYNMRVLDKDTFACEKRNVKWYDHEEDLIKLSKSFPMLTFDLFGDGEDRPDFWKMRFRNGESERVVGEVIYPDFVELTD